MYSYTQVIKGLEEYLNTEIIAKVSGWQKWVVGSGLSIALSKGTNVFNNLKENKMIQTLEIIDTDNNIDVELLFTHLRKQAEESAITFDAPIIGALTLNKEDVDKLYTCITKGVE